ncbi:LON peptidase substrate-binding domain-containing protein [Aliidiomarina haloalkalitolerans]|uniref:Peptidase S16 n=1 Tax=Aliidiomarina haloalkalitolerans TaxID=859059 RepID=A0A432VYM1_9GAMM|nr:LON peptidase substrate-binding domain-containing protein [Aliidiomarina haloalkalitolerans]RUO21757.1 peptidase S16 [Aliidiomarina haloalkalitolerans]
MATPNSTTLGLFPLTSTVLPGGRMQLRVYEPRYLRLVRESLREQTGFGLCMLNPNGDRDLNTHVYKVGTLVRIIDFETLADGYLGITILGERLFEIDEIETESDGLRRGHVHFKSPAASIPMTDSEVWAHELKQRLEEVFNNYPEIARLYPDRNFEDPTWVCNRWLELLPLPGEVKQDLLSENNFSQMLAYLAQLFAENEQQNELN